MSFLSWVVFFLDERRTVKSQWRRPGGRWAETTEERGGGGGLTGEGRQSSNAAEDLQPSTGKGEALVGKLLGQGGAAQSEGGLVGMGGARRGGADGAGRGWSGLVLGGLGGAGRGKVGPGGG